jgi:hypothetical protein
MEVISQLDQQARSNLPRINNSTSIKEYFQAGAGYLRNAATAKRSQDLNNAYLYLKQYTM